MVRGQCLISIPLLQLVHMEDLPLPSHWGADVGYLGEVSLIVFSKLVEIMVIIVEERVAASLFRISYID